MQQNYPNPFREETSFPIHLAESSLVTIELYDLTGKKVTSVIDKQRLSSGNQTVKLSRNQLQSGMYMAKVKVENTKGNFVETLKVVVR